jgi:hypothetical protein
MANTRAKKDSKSTKTTNPTPHPTSTTSPQPRPKPVIKVPALRPPTQAMNENLPPREPPSPAISNSVEHPDPPLSSQEASTPLQPSTAVNTNQPTTSKPTEVPNPAPDQRWATFPSGSTQLSNPVHHKKSATTSASTVSAESEATLAAKYANALGMFGPFDKVIPLTFI